MGIGSHNYGDWEVPRYAIWKQENQEIKYLILSEPKSLRTRDGSCYWLLVQVAASKGLKTRHSNIWGIEKMNVPDPEE
jgi:hypothetical protein